MYIVSYKKSWWSRTEINMCKACEKYRDCEKLAKIVARNSKLSLVFLVKNIEGE